MSKKIMFPLVLICSALAIWSFSSVGKDIHKMERVHQSANSLNICFERVGQSFMAVMLKDFKNEYLGNDFIKTTSQCFDELKEQLEGVQINWTSALKKANYLLTDYHWMGEEVQRFYNNGPEGDISENMENILNYYQKVEGHKNALFNIIEKSEKNLKPSTWSNSSFYVSLICLSLLALWGIFQGTDQNQQATQTLVANQEKRKDLEAALQMDEVAPAGEWEDIESNTVGGFDLDNLSTPDMIESSESLNLNLIATGVASVLGNKAFAYGVMMDFEVSEDLYVKSQEDSVNQLMYSLIVYLMEGLKAKEGSRRIKISAKSTDSESKKVELIIRADGVRFSKQELNYINLRSNSAEDALEGEIQICREITQMSDIKLKLVNGMIDSEGYAKFVVNLRKGEPKNLFITPASQKTVKDLPAPLS